jgi:hypothetical protein
MLGPFVCGWLKDGPIGVINHGDEIVETLSETLLMAEVPVEGIAEPLDLSRDLMVYVNNAPMPEYRTGRWETKWEQGAIQMDSRAAFEVAVDIPRWLLDASPDFINLELEYTSEDDGRVSYFPQNEGFKWEKGRKSEVTEREVFGTRVNVIRYRIDDWRKYVQGPNMLLMGRLAVFGKPGQNRGQWGWARVRVRAWASVDQADNEGDWVPWP